VVVAVLALSRDTFAKELATRGIEHDTLDLRAADVNAEAMHGSWILPQHGIPVSLSLRRLIEMSALSIEEIELNESSYGLARATSHNFKPT
jgi:hypothetical protein